MRKIVIAITGASGVCYAKRLFDCLLGKAEVHVLISERGHELINLELGIKRDYFIKKGAICYKNNQMNVSVASGSFPGFAMVIVPASMGTVGRIASGISSTLIERTADVFLKEKSKLIIVPRESPFNAIHLENLLTLDRAGAIVLPASPGFYNDPKSIDDLIDFVVARILKHLDIDQELLPPYSPN